MKKSIWLSIIFNPLAVLIYTLICSLITIGTQYGNLTSKIPILLTSFLILIAWLSWCLYRLLKFKRKTAALPFVSKVSIDYGTASKLWLIIAGLAVFSSTLEVSTSVHQNASALREEVTSYVEDLKNTRQVKFDQDNLYEDRLKGLFENVQEEISLPQELYLANDFELTFNREGKILSLSSSVYGLNEKNEKESYLIEYDCSQGNDIQVRLTESIGTDYDEKKKLQPLIEMLDTAPIEEAVTQWTDQDTFNLVYQGLYNWGYDSQGILSLDAEGYTAPLESGEHQIIGYTVAISTPENQTIKPIRYVQLLAQTHPLYEEMQLNDMSESNESTIDTFYVNTKLGYHLKQVDAAMGSFFYVLNHTYDGGNTWVTINSDPFSGNLGVVSGVVFINKDVGFIGLSKSGGSFAELYQTKDGGSSFEKVVLPPIEVPLTNSRMQMPFDFPEMPYQENGRLMLLVNQGQDNDYNGGSKALYQSTDNGDSWEFVEEVN